MNLQSSILLGEEEQFYTEDVAVKDAIIKYRASHDRYYTTKVADMILHVKRDGETADQFRSRVPNNLPDIALGFSNLFLEIQTEHNGKMERAVMPVREIAFRSILERARLSGFTFTNDEKCPDCDALSLETKAEFINKALKLYSGSAKILFRDWRVTSAMSEQYYPIGIDILDDGLQEGLKDKFDNVEFKGLTISQEFFSERYYVNDIEVESDVALMLSDAGLDVKDIHVCVDAYTGDHGNIAATYIARLKLDDGYVAFGKPVSVKHSGRKSKESLVRAASKLYSMFRNAEAALKALMNVKITHPDGCIRLLAKEFRLPKKEAMEVAAEFENRTDVTGYEIYFALNDIVRRADVQDFQRAITLQEAVAETLTQDYTKYDKVFLWARHSKSSADEEEDAVDLATICNDLDDSDNLPTSDEDPAA